MTLASGIVKNGSLIRYADWSTVVNTLQQKHSSPSKVVLLKSIAEAIRNRIPSVPFGLLFSGGVDSSVIAKILQNFHQTFNCYTVGFQAEHGQVPNDILYARKVSSALNLPLIEKIFTLHEIESILKQTVRIIPKQEPSSDYVVRISVAAVIVAATSIATEKTFFGGLGSEEIFAGYERHAKATDINEECWEGLKKMWNRDLTRDFAVAQSLNVTLLTPFLDGNVIQAAMDFPGSEKIQGDVKKVVLREVAESIGLPSEFAWRKKQGAQYGSKFDKAIAKLAHQHGFTRKGEYLLSL